MRILVTGNCQARPLGDIIKSTTGFQIEDPIILHLSKEEDREEHQGRIASADIILAQNTSENFSPAHLRSSRIKAEHENKTIIWPNLFYVGQQPTIRYLTAIGAGRIFGPLEAYHSIDILYAWANDRGVAQVIDLVTAEDVINLPKQSFDEFVDREKKCDIQVSDLIAENLNDRPLFFVFNHPTEWLLTRMAERIVKCAFGLSQRYHELAFGEPLNRVVVPSIWAPSLAPYRGVEVDLLDSQQIKIGSARHYDHDALTARFYQVYDHFEERLSTSKLRLTPSLRV